MSSSGNDQKVTRGIWLTLEQRLAFDASRSSELGEESRYVVFATLTVHLIHWLANGVHVITLLANGVG
jgi:hypothetical protein